MRLIKLLVYSLVGYVLYELYLGMTEQQESGDSSRSTTSRRKGSMAGGASQRITGPGRGTSVSTQETGGGTRRQTVGRGVVVE